MQPMEESHAAAADRKEGEDCEMKEVDDGEGKDEDLEAEEEGVCHKEVTDPGQPSRAEREQHELTHIPFRSWCPHCVRGRGK